MGKLYVGEKLISVKIFRKDEEMEKLLEKDNVVSIKGGTVVYLKSKDNINFEVPDFVMPYIESGEAEIFINVTECGGDFEQGSTIVCGNRGQRLTSYHIPKRKAPNGDHAFFSVRKCVVVCANPYPDMKVNIYSLSTERVDNVVKLKIIELQKIEEFNNAIKAAISKANRYNCRDVFYVSSGKPQKPE